MHFKSFLKSVLLIAILPNIALVFLAAWFDLNRPYVNLDYLVVSLLMLTRLRWLGVVCFVLLFFIDLIALAGQVFLFIRPDNLLYLAKFIPETSGIYQLGIVGLVLLLVLLTYLQFSTSRFINKLHTLIIFNVALIFYGMNVYGTGDPDERVYRVKNSPTVDSQLLFLINNRGDGFIESFNSEGTALSDIKVSGASSDWFNLTSLTSKTNLLLIVSESWGVPQDERIQRALLAPLTKVGHKIKNYQVGQLNFGGPTLAAELRELCQLDSYHYNLKDVTTGFENCLPNKLKQYGYKTQAMHGATGVMYDRIYWYPRAGFDQSTFFETQSWPRRCYSFPGACDIDMFEIAHRFFSDTQPGFLYWLTLNSHSIYDERDIHIDVFDCQRFAVAQTTQTCRNLKLQAQYFHSLANAIDQGNLDGVEVIITGDHPPIITNQEEKLTYFVDNKVPWIRFNIAE